MARSLILRKFSLLWLFFSFTIPLHAWDAVGHRLSAAILYEHLSESRRDELHSLLLQHPRYMEDFQAQMPDFVRNSDKDVKTLWLLGQAAIWPDLARRFPAQEQRRFHRPTWHYIDGRWLLSPEQQASTLQGNVYIGMAALPAIINHAPQNIREESDVDNMILALEYSLLRLRNENLSAADRAVALCWVMHLSGDIHQPLHAGALFSVSLFPEGDRGGNAIETVGGNLHARWDQALRGQNYAQLQQRLLDAANELIPLADSSSATWLQESREILHNSVYTDTMRSAILSSERSGQALPRFTLSAAYLQQMTDTAEQRIVLAGLRLAILLQ